MRYGQKNPKKNGTDTPFIHQSYSRDSIYPELVVSATDKEEEARYYAALELVMQIDEDLTKGTRHYRNKAGILLTTLDEVIHAILFDDLYLPEEFYMDDDIDDMDDFWDAPQQLAA